MDTMHNTIQSMELKQSIQFVLHIEHFKYLETVFLYLSNSLLHKVSIDRTVLQTVFITPVFSVLQSLELDALFLLAEKDSFSSFSIPVAMLSAKV